MSEIILEMENISKSFPGVKALDGVQFRIYKGEAMGFIGENGAGKSTLMKIISGAYQKDEGTMVLEGEEYKPEKPKDAMDKGIAIIHQEFNLADNMNVYENIYLGRELVDNGRLDKKAMYEDSKAILERLQVDIDPKEIVGRLSLAQKQMVEIARAISTNAKIIIMDEPTDALTSKEVDKLLEVIDQLKKEGKGIVYISHRLEEIGQICERFIVLRDGKYIDEKAVADSNQDEVIKMMVGRDLDDYIPYQPAEGQEVSFEIRNLSNDYIKDLSFDIKKGEVLGVAGLVGAGRSELGKTIYGSYPKQTGQIYHEGQLLDINNEKDAIEAGIFYVSEDRKMEGLILGMSVRDNMTLSSLDKFVSGGRISKEAEARLVDQYIEDMRIKTPNPNQIVENLSGGNQQKVSIAKGIMTDPSLLILDEPTRGVDVGAKREMYVLLNEIKAQGRSILLISSEMNEILGLADRILVIDGGQLKGELAREEASQEKIMELIVKGGSDEGEV